MMREVKELSPARQASWSDRIGRVVDSLAYAVSPAWGMKRMAARRDWTAFSAVYHGGATGDRLHEGKWLTNRISPDSALEADLDGMRDKSHELYRGDAIGGSVDLMVDHIVGKGFTMNAKIKPNEGISEDAADGFNRSIEAMIERWSKAVDVSRLESWWEIDRLMCRHLLIDGEAFLRFHNSQDAGVPIPLYLEVVDPERVETPPERSGDPLCRLGIQYDERGAVIGYWIRTTHPDDTRRLEIKYEFVLKSKCLHLLEKWFTGQSRGYPWLTRVLNEIRDGKDLKEAGIVTQQTQACLSVWIVDPINPMQAANARATARDSSGRKIQSVEPGSVNYSTSQPYFMQPSGASSLDALLRINDHRIAAGINVPYEFLARNWSGISFAGGRLILSGAKLSVGIKQQLIAVRAKSPTYEEAVRQGVIVGAVDINPMAFNRRSWVYQRHIVTPPLWQYAITPGEEVRALKEAVDAMLTTQEAATAQYSGMDLDEVIPQRGKEMEAARQAGCLPPKDKLAEAAIMQAEAAHANTPQGREMANA